LGNPGARHAGERHNIGYMAADAIARTHGFGPWRAKFQGEIAEGRLAGHRAMLLKPATFMNLSGDSVQAATRFFKLTAADVIVFHDELDLAPGKVRVKTGGGHAGHNGLRSLDAHIGPGFVRVRLGIGHPGDKRLVSGYVLGDFARSDADWLQPLLAGVAEGAPALADGDTPGFLDAVNRLRPPPQPPAAAPGPSDSEPAPQAADARSPLQRLVDRFR
jgi:PTH1 family peptidyl-tRNA hydrolase